MNLKDKLKKIRWMGWLGRYDGSQGICGMLKIHAKLTRDENVQMLGLFREWPEGTGGGMFPVPGLEGVSSYDAYSVASCCDAMWSPFTRYGRSRRRLLNWLIKQL